MLGYLLVFVGGGLGSVLRFAIGLALQKSNLNLPVATLIANLVSCALFAAVLTQLPNKTNNNFQLNLLLLTGFCGGLSTFSAFSYETFLLLKEGMFVYAIGNILLSVSLCLTLFYLMLK